MLLQVIKARLRALIENKHGSVRSFSRLPRAGGDSPTPQWVERRFFAEHSEGRRDVTFSFLEEVCTLLGVPDDALLHPVVTPGDVVALRWISSQRPTLEAADAAHPPIGHRASVTQRLIDQALVQADDGRLAPTADGRRVLDEHAVD